jgi:hypothetical protein
MPDNTRTPLYVAASSVSTWPRVVGAGADRATNHPRRRRPRASVCARPQASSPLVSPEKAVSLLGTMMGGYNIDPMVKALSDPALADAAVAGLSKTLLMFDAFYDVKELADGGNESAAQVIQNWANATWYTNKPEVPDKMTVTVFMVTGETNTDDLSPAPDAWSRPDIPLHALAMLKNERCVPRRRRPSSSSSARARGHIGSCLSRSRFRAAVDRSCSPSSTGTAESTTDHESNV